MIPGGQMKGFPRGSETKNPPAAQEEQETRVGSLGREEPLEKEMAPRCSILAWKIPRTAEPDQKLRGEMASLTAGSPSTSPARGTQEVLSKDSPTEISSGPASADLRNTRMAGVTQLRAPEENPFYGCKNEARDLKTEAPKGERSCSRPPGQQRHKIHSAAHTHSCEIDSNNASGRRTLPILWACKEACAAGASEHAHLPEKQHLQGKSQQLFSSTMADQLPHSLSGVAQANTTSSVMGLASCPGQLNTGHGDLSASPLIIPSATALCWTGSLDWDSHLDDQPMKTRTTVEADFHPKHGLLYPLRLPVLLNASCPLLVGILQTLLKPSKRSSIWFAKPGTIQSVTSPSLPFPGR
ncbi:hypothetical protein CapIbe_009096 [Capra ibex]